VTFFPLSIERTSLMLHQALLARFPQLSGVKISHSWGGQVAVTFDRLPHIGGGNGLYFVAGCQGSGITTMTYLGSNLATKIIHAADDVPVNSYDTGLPPQRLFYDGRAWFMPAVGSWFQIQDRWERG
jgi:glycine/D-amino acid oxidase-like deaminating enzyme